MSHRPAATALTPQLVDPSADAPGAPHSPTLTRRAFVVGTASLAAAGALALGGCSVEQPT